MSKLVNPLAPKITSCVKVNNPIITKVAAHWIILKVVVSNRTFIYRGTRDLKRIAKCHIDITENLFHDIHIEITERFISGKPYIRAYFNNRVLHNN
ncbi:hypothetical protein [Bacteroides uniformis]|uniref:hypothetical protein n=1 Tax=Bacteroides uniformis TaxID=820 RepID=UPI001921C5B2|nr:hypothetical protein [Bacteroides uniformis]